MVEEWRLVVGYGDYEVSNTGLIRNKHSLCILKPMRTGRAKVRLSTNPRVDFNVAHLVLTAFSEEPRAGRIAMHLDDNPYNNSLDNLRWGTMQDNARDMATKGRGGIQKLSATDVDNIRRRRIAGERGRLLAEEYGVSEQRICDIYNGRTTL